MSDQASLIAKRLARALKRVINDVKKLSDAPESLVKLAARAETFLADAQKAEGRESKRPAAKACEALALVASPAKRRRAAAAAAAAGGAASASGATSAPSASIAANSSKNASCAPLVVDDPTKSFQCYDVLGVLRSASPMEIRRAFRGRALAAHPDKPGGHPKAFICLQKAFEVLQDPSQRAEYDRDLMARKSVDGTGDRADIGSDLAMERLVACPEMLNELFLNVDVDCWPKLIKALSRENVYCLLRFLNHSEQLGAPLAKETATEFKGISTAGVKRSGTKYNGKLVLQNLHFSTFTTDLSAALDGRIALLRLQARVLEILPLNGNDFDDAVRKAVDEVRTCEQASAFYMKFNFEYSSTIQQRGRAKRFTSPITFDLDTALGHRRVFHELGERGAELEEIDNARKRMVATEEAKKRVYSAERAQRARRLLTQLRRHQEELSRNTTATLALEFEGGSHLLAETQFKVISELKVGVLPRPDIKAETTTHLRPGSIFGVSSVTKRGGRNFMQLASGGGWVPEHSRKNPEKRVIEVIEEQRGAAAAVAMLEDAPPAVANKDAPPSDSESSSSSSSSS